MTTAPGHQASYRVPQRLCTAIIAASALWSTLATADAPPGHVTVAIPLPQASLGQGGTNVGEPLRQSLMLRLRASSVEVVPLESVDPAQIGAEATAKHATYVLYARLEQKHSGGLGGMLHKLAPFANALPMLGGRGGGLGNLASSALAQSAASSAASTAQQQALSQMTGAQQSSIKSGDTLTLEYRLMAPGATTPVGSATLQRKASADGEDVLAPLVEQVANAVVASSGGSAAAGAAPASAPSSGGRSIFGGLFGHKGNAASTPPSSASGPAPDCAQMAAMPGVGMSYESCQKMLAAKQQYDTAAADPGAMRPGDEQLSCDQLVAEFKQQNITAPDKASTAQAVAAVTKERSMLAQNQADFARTTAVQQAAVSAAASADRATMLATGGLVDPNRAGTLAETFQAQDRAMGEKWNKERLPTEQKVNNSTADFGLGAARQVTANPRIARLMQLMSAKRCKAST